MASRPPNVKTRSLSSTSEAGQSLSPTSTPRSARSSGRYHRISTAGRQSATFTSRRERIARQWETYRNSISPTDMERAHERRVEEQQGSIISRMTNAWGSATPRMSATLERITSTRNVFFKTMMRPTLADASPAISLAAEAMLEKCLRDHFLFSDLSELTLETVIRGMRRQRVMPGEMIMREGESGHTFYAVESGDFDIYVNNEWVSSVGKGQCFGELALLSPDGLRKATVLCRAVSHRPGLGEAAPPVNMQEVSAVLMDISESEQIVNTTTFDMDSSDVQVMSNGGVLWSLAGADFRAALAMNRVRELEDRRRMLEKVDFFRDLTPTQLSLLSQAVVTQHFDAGERIISKGEQGGAMFILTEGSVVCHSFTRPSDKKKSTPRAHLQKPAFAPPPVPPPAAAPAAPAAAAQPRAPGSNPRILTPVNTTSAGAAAAELRRPRGEFFDVDEEESQLPGNVSGADVGGSDGRSSLASFSEASDVDAMQRKSESVRNSRKRINHSITTLELRPPAAFGEQALLYREPRAANCDAGREGAVVMKVNVAVFHELLGPIREVLERNFRLKVISEVNGFAQLSHEARSNLAEAMSHESYSHASQLFAQGDAAESAYIIRWGAVRLIHTEDDGSVTEETRYRGRCIGEEALMGLPRYLETAICESLPKDGTSALDARPRASGPPSAAVGHSGIELYKLDNTALREAGFIRVSAAEQPLGFKPLPLYAIGNVINRVTQRMSGRQRTPRQSMPPIRGDAAGGTLSFDLDPEAKGTADRRNTLSVNTKFAPDVNWPQMKRRSDQMRAPALPEDAPAEDAPAPAPAQAEAERTPEAAEDPLVLTSVLGTNSSWKFPESLVPENPLPGKTTGAEEFEFMRTLGVGSFGTVKLARHRETDAAVAIKQIAKAYVAVTRQQQYVAEERRILLTLKHPFIVQLYGTFQDQDNLYLVMEVCQGGEIFRIMHGDGTLENVLDADQARFYVANLLSVFGYIHSRNIVYRDLKPENVLVGSDGYLKVTDWGIAKQLPDSLGVTFTMVGTPEYMAPETVKGTGHGKPVDYWALGVVLFEMLAGYSCFVGDDVNDTVQVCANVVDMEVAFPGPDEESSFDDLSKDLVSRLLEKDPLKRLGSLHGGATDVWTHAWLDGYDIEAITQRAVAPPWVPALSGDDDVTHFDEFDASDEEHCTMPYEGPQDEPWKDF